MICGALASTVNLAAINTDVNEYEGLYVHLVAVTIAT